MKTFVKNYIGKGKKVENLDIVQVSINLEKADEFIFEYEGQHYLKFEVATRKAADNFGNTHTVYVNQMLEDPETVPAPAKQKASRKPRKKKVS